MKKTKLKKKSTFSLIAFLLCCVLIYSANNVYDLTGRLNRQIEIIKEKEMKFIYGERNILGDKYSHERSVYETDHVNQVDINSSGNDLLATEINNYWEYMPFRNVYISPEESWYDFMAKMAEHKTFSEKLKKQVEEHSYRNKNLGFYYVFDFDYTMGSIKELDSAIEKVSIAQKVPKALISAVLFREMMFLGQEDLLDGLPIIGGKSIGICQIGIENAKYNEITVHGEDSYIARASGEQIKDMLQNPKQAVYFCAVQLKARAIKLTDNRDIDLNDLNEKQLHKILEEYNQSKVTITIGPIKTKQKYADETYTYYKLFSEYYRLEN